MVKSAAALSRLPMVAAAFAAGEINDAHVATIARVADALPPQALQGGAEELLVRQASQLAPSKFAPVATRIREQASPLPEPRPPTKRKPTKWLQTEQHDDGRVRMSGMFDRANGRIVLEALAAATAAMPAAEQSASVRNADALLELCRLAVHDVNGLRSARESTAASPGRPAGRKHPAARDVHSAGPSTLSSVGAASVGSANAGLINSKRSMRSLDSMAKAAQPDTSSPVDNNTAATTGRQARTDARAAGTSRKAKRTHRRHKQQRSPNRR
jgi:hypothetical protein